MASYLFVCSGGGHLKEMFALSRLLGVDPEEQHWATVDSALSRTLLADRRVTHLADPPPRAVVPVLRNAMIGRSLLARGSFDAVFSTGASPALSFLPLAASRGIPCALHRERRPRARPVDDRSDPRPGPRRLDLHPVPLLGRRPLELRRLDLRHLPRRGRRPAADPPRRGLGRHAGRLPVPRFFAALAPLLEGVEVLWQTGANDVSGLGIDGRHPCRTTSSTPR